MTNQDSTTPGSGTSGHYDTIPFDASKPNGPRIYDYLLGGKNNFEVDRGAAERILAVAPQAAVAVRQNRDFLTRSVRWLASEQGVTQFLDIGCGLPAASSVHEVAQGVHPTARIVYVDNDAVVLSHARALLASSSQGACAYIDADLREPAHILRHARATLDFTEPIGVMMLGVLQYIPDEDDPYGVVRDLMGATPQGSFLAISHGTDDDNDPLRIAELNKIYGETPNGLLRPRSYDQVLRFFEGLWVAEPGLTNVATWRPDSETIGKPDRPLFWGGIGKRG